MMRFALPTTGQVADCSGCGACCTEQCGLPVLEYIGPYRREDPSKLPAALRAELEATLQGWKDNDSWLQDGSPCVWYDAEKRECKHYEHRPQMCRVLVKVGDESCLRWRRLKGIDGKTTYSFSRGRLTKMEIKK